MALITLFPIIPIRHNAVMNLQIMQNLTLYLWHVPQSAITWFYQYICT